MHLFVGKALQANGTKCLPDFLNVLKSDIPELANLIHRNMVLETCCIKQTDFQTNMSQRIGMLRKSSESSDATFVCEDGKKIFAHKTILMISSPFFKNLFGENNKRSFLFMIGIQAETLECIMEYIYKGETSCGKGELKDFLSLAKDLQVAGLELGELASSKVKQQSLQRKLNLENDNVVVTSEEEITKLNELIASKMEKNPDRGNEERRGRSEWRCKECGKVGMKANVVTHVEGRHIGGWLHPCYVCQRAYSSRHLLAKHLSKCTSEEPKLNVGLKKRKLINT